MPSESNRHAGDPSANRVSGTRMPAPQSWATPSRRSVLAAIAGTTAGASGCLQRASSVVNRTGPEPISLSIKSVPSDSDPRSIFVARFLAEKLTEVGIDAEVVPMRREELIRDVLVNERFDVYVARHPARHDPDFLRPLLHSRFASEPGWQNPFGYANLQVDDLLVEQRTQSGPPRIETLREVQRTIATDCPFAVVAFPYDVRAVRTDRVVGWADYPLHTPESYLRIHESDAVEGADATPDDEASELRMTVTDPRPTKNLNPLSVEFRDVGTVTGLLYDPLARRIDGTIVPWLAESWEWIEEPVTGGPVVEVTLRDDLTWHDGERLTAEDVAFTYEFLTDTALGGLDIPVPAPRFRGRSSLVVEAVARDARTVAVEFVPSSRETALRALSVPILPAHVWRETATEATVASLGDGSVTEALVWENMDPVGSGPLEYERSTVNERLDLVPFEDHFLERESLDDPTRPFEGGFSFDRLTFAVVPSDEAAIETLLSGGADGTASTVTPEGVPPVGASDVARLEVDRPTAFYHVGFNVRSAPLSNTRFRRAVAGLLDKEYLVSQALDDFAVPATSPLQPHEAMSPVLEWDGKDAELPFPGQDGTLDLARARERFVEAGYRYREDLGVLVS